MSSSAVVNQNRTTNSIATPTKPVGILELNKNVEKRLRILELNKKVKE